MAVETDVELQKIKAEEITPVGEDIEDVQEFQGSVFDALLAAAGYESDNSECYLIRIKRQIKGVETVILKFQVHPLSEEKINAVRKKNTKVKRDRRYGIDRETLDSVRFRSQLIYEATVEADREAIWNNRKAWEKLNVLNGIDLIDKVLMAGEKDRLLEAIESISGYGTADELEVLVKN